MTSAFSIQILDIDDVTGFFLSVNILRIIPTSCLPTFHQDLVSICGVNKQFSFRLYDLCQNNYVIRGDLSDFFHFP